MEIKMDEDLELFINEGKQLLEQSEGPTDKIAGNQIYIQFQSFDSSKSHQEEDNSFVQQLNLLFHEPRVYENEQGSNNEQFEKEQVSNNKQFKRTNDRNVDDVSSFNFHENFDSQQGPEIQNNQQALVSTKVDTKFPGETKNLPKCLARRIQDYISSVVQVSEDPELKKTLNNPEIKRFLELKPEKITKQKLDLFIQSEIGSIFCKEFFGNCRWSYGITKEGKTNVETCFRYNIQYFTKTIKKRKLN